MWVFNARHDFGVETDPTEGEFFVNNDVDRSSALVREAVQNSLDARRDDAGTVEVRFAFQGGSLFLDPAPIRRYCDGLRPHLRACGVDIDEAAMDDPQLLLVEDFGTHGLRGDPASNAASDFYYFWHVGGRSGKGDTKAGRWGLGKTVFPNSSRLSAFFGYTIRSDDARRILFGQTCLRTHALEGVVHLPYAFYQSSPARQYELPIADRAMLDAFVKDFRLSRQAETGLSVVIPFPYPEITESALLEAAIEHYFYPVLAGRLVIRVNERALNAETILGLAAGMQSRRLRDIEKALAFAAEIQRLAADAVGTVGVPSKLNTEAGRIPPEAFAPDHLSALRHDFREGRIIAIRIPVQIEPMSAPAEPSFVTVFIKRDPLLFRGHDYYLRGGITLSGQSVFGGRPALGILLAEDVPVCRFLGDAENPAHTLWNPRSARLSAKYRHARETVMFIREAMGSLLDTLTQEAAEEDRQALSDIFFTPRRSDRAQGARETKAEDKPPADIAAAPPRLIIVPIRGGFKVKAGTGLDPACLPLPVALSAAYGIREGNPFAKYASHDFRLEREPIAITAAGVTGLKPAGHRLSFAATSPDFEVEVVGFDTHRDLAVRIQEEEEG